MTAKSFKEIIRNSNYETEISFKPAKSVTRDLSTPGVNANFGIPSTYTHELSSCTLLYHKADVECATKYKDLTYVNV